MRDFVYLALFMGLISLVDGLGVLEPGGSVCLIAESLFSTEDCVRRDAAPLDPAQPIHYREWTLPQT